MELKEIMLNDLIIFDEGIRSKDDLFDCLAKRLEEQNRVSKAKRIVKDLYKREKETSTGIEDGFGIPHAKSKYVLEPTVCFAHTGLMEDYVGLDGKPVECVFAILVPQKAVDLHLDILSGLSRRLMNQDFRDQLKKAKTAAEVLHIL